ncbi:MAG: hypothetical protein MUP26_03975, partial [Desulfobulbaceae bacterium]|nr:hypothetical protein [Desulfobulbaceae bacterium]
DDSEMATAAASGLNVSNHSYASITGWSSSGGDWYWYGNQIPFLGKYTAAFLGIFNKIIKVVLGTGKYIDRLQREECRKQEADYYY